MSLFSYDHGQAPADRAHEQLLDLIEMLHDSQKARADLLRNVANHMDDAREIWESELSRIALVLARGVMQDQPEDGDELGAQDHAQRT